MNSRTRSDARLGIIRIKKVLILGAELMGGISISNREPSGQIRTQGTNLIKGWQKRVKGQRSKLKSAPGQPEQKCLTIVLLTVVRRQAGCVRCS